MTATHSTSRTSHVVRKTRNGDLELVPGKGPRNTALILATFIPLLLHLGLEYGWGTRVIVAVSLLPIAGSGGFALIHFFTQRFGIRARFSPKQQNILLCRRELFGQSIEETLPFDSIQAVQLVFMREITIRFKEYKDDDYRTSGESWDSYQLILYLQDDSKKKLLESGSKKKMKLMGEQISELLRVPFEMIEKDTNQDGH